MLSLAGTVAASGQGLLSDQIDQTVRKLVIHANADSFFVEMNQNLHYIASGDTLAFTGRLARFIVIARGRKERGVSYSTVLGQVQRFELFLEPENRPERSRYVVLKTGLNLVVHAAPQTRILIDGQVAGTGIHWFSKPPGRYPIRLVNPDGLSRNLTAKVTENRLTYQMRTVQPDRGTAFALSLLPGAAQYRKHQPVKGVSLQLAFVAGIAGSYLLDQQFRDSRSGFRDIREQYRMAASDNLAFELGQQMDKAASTTNRHLLYRHLAAGATVLVYAFNVWDGNRPPAGGFERLDRINPWFDFHEGTGMAAGLTYTLDL